MSRGFWGERKKLLPRSITGVFIVFNFSRAFLILYYPCLFELNFTVRSIPRFLYGYYALRSSINSFIGLYLRVPFFVKVPLKAFFHGFFTSFNFILFSRYFYRLPQTVGVSLVVIATTPPFFELFLFSPSFYSRCPSLRTTANSDRRSVRGNHLDYFSLFLFPPFSARR